MKESSAVYMVSTASILEQGCPVMQRTRENAYKSHRQHRRKSQDERGRLWDELKESISSAGFDPDQPITIQLLRKNAQEDKIQDGNHRFAMAIELEIAQIPVRFLFDDLA